MKIRSFIFIILIIPAFAFISPENHTIFGKIYKNNKTDPASGVTIEIYTAPSGKGKKLISLKSGINGNFKSDKMINFSSGLYPVLKYKQTEKYMKIPAKTGNCLICHTNIKLTVE